MWGRGRDSASFFNADLLQYKTLIRCIRDDYWTVLSAINKIKVIREEQINWLLLQGGWLWQQARVCSYCYLHTPYMRSSTYYSSVLNGNKSSCISLLKFIWTIKKNFKKIKITMESIHLWWYNLYVSVP